MTTALVCDFFPWSRFVVLVDPGVMGEDLISPSVIMNGLPNSSVFGAAVGDLLLVADGVPWIPHLFLKRRIWEFCFLSVRILFILVDHGRSVIGLPYSSVFGTKIGFPNISVLGAGVGHPNASVYTYDRCCFEWIVGYFPESFGTARWRVIFFVLSNRLIVFFMFLFMTGLWNGSTLKKKCTCSFYIFILLACQFFGV